MCFIIGVASAVLLLPAIIYRWCLSYRRIIIPGACYRRYINHRCQRIDENLEQGLITGVNETADNLLPVTTTPAVNTKLRIPPRIFIKNFKWSQQDTQGPGGNSL